MSYFDDINGFSNSVQERLAHQKQLAQELSDSKVKSIEDAYNTLQGAIQAGAGISAGIGASATLVKKVLAKRAGKPVPDDDEGKPAPDSGEKTGDNPDSSEAPTGSSSTEAPSSSQASGDTAEGGSGEAPTDAPEPPAGDLSKNIGASTEGGEEEEGGEGLEGAGAGAEAGEGAEGISELGNVVSKGVSTASKVGQVLGDIGEGVADFVDPAGLIISAGLGLASLFENLFGKKHATGGEEEKAQITEPSQIVGGGEDPTALSASAS